MKNLFFCLAFLFANILHAQNASDAQILVTEQNILGKWIFADLINPDLTREQYEENKSLMDGAFGFTFNSDKTCVIMMIFDLEGKWSLNPKTKIIETVDQKGAKTWQIHALSDNEMTLSLNNAKQQLIFKRVL